MRDRGTLRQQARPRLDRRPGAWDRDVRRGGAAPGDPRRDHRRGRGGRRAARRHPGAIHAGLARADLLPGRRLVDAGYDHGPRRVAARAGDGIDLLGPIYADHQWQAKTGQGFAPGQFRVDWDARRASIRWTETHTARGRTRIRVDFAPDDCAPCPARALRTRARAGRAA